MCVCCNFVFVLLICCGSIVECVNTWLVGYVCEVGKSVLINPRRACAARVIVIIPCVCVCLSVCYYYSGTTGYEAAKERYQRP